MGDDEEEEEQGEEEGKEVRKEAQEEVEEVEKVEEVGLERRDEVVGREAVGGRGTAADMAS